MDPIDVSHFMPTLIAMVGERLPDGPERDEFDAMPFEELDEIARAAPGNLHWRRFMAALSPEARDEVAKALVAAVLPRKH
jgi:hypothetical protein